jgi:hypothetical protein
VPKITIWKKCLKIEHQNRSINLNWRVEDGKYVRKVSCLVTEQVKSLIRHVGDDLHQDSKGSSVIFHLLCLEGNSVILPSIKFWLKQNVNLEKVTRYTFLPMALQTKLGLGLPFL